MYNMDFCSNYSNCQLFFCLFGFFSCCDFIFYENSNLLKTLAYFALFLFLVWLFLDSINSFNCMSWMYFDFSNKQAKKIDRYRLRTILHYKCDKPFAMALFISQILLCFLLSHTICGSLVCCTAPDEMWIVNCGSARIKAEIILLSRNAFSSKLFYHSRYEK